MTDKNNGVDTSVPSKREKAEAKPDKNYEPGKTGAVLDPEHDGRLKENRKTGTTLGTTAHSATAPNAQK